MTDPRRFSDACERNKGPILEVLRQVLPKTGLVLEVAAGSGQHAVHFAQHLTDLTWLSSDADEVAIASICSHREHARLANLRPPVQFDVHSPFWPIDEADAVFCANLVHVAPWTATEALMRGAASVLNTGGLLVMYGPYFIEGEEPAPSNVAFDLALKEQDPEWGLRTLSDLESVALGQGFEVMDKIRMPANNMMVIFARSAPHPIS